MRIASITNSPLDASLGSGKTVLAWSDGLRKLGHSVDVFGPEHYFRPWLGGHANRLKMRLDALGLHGRIGGGRYDLVELYGAEFGPLIRKLRASRIGKVPLLIAHTDGLELLAKHSPQPAGRSRATMARGATWLMDRLLVPWDHAAFAEVDAFVAGCETDTAYLVERGILPPERAITIELGIDSEFLGADWSRKKEPRIIALSTWTERKDPATLCAVVTRVLRSIPSVNFDFVGAACAREEILSTFESDVRDRVSVHPRLSTAEVAELLTRASVLIFPSLYEGFGMAITEAMACGCVPIVTPTGFGADVRDGMDGYVCGFRDVNSMTEAVERVLLDEPLRSRMAAAARTRVSDLTWEAQVRRLEAAYQAWVAEAVDPS